MTKNQRLERAMLALGWEPDSQGWWETKAKDKRLRKWELDNANLPMYLAALLIERAQNADGEFEIGVNRKKEDSGLPYHYAILRFPDRDVSTNAVTLTWSDAVIKAWLKAAGN